MEIPRIKTRYNGFFIVSDECVMSDRQIWANIRREECFRLRSPLNDSLV